MEKKKKRKIYSPYTDKRLVAAQNAGTQMWKGAGRNVTGFVNNNLGGNMLLDAGKAAGNVATAATSRVTGAIDKQKGYFADVKAGQEKYPSLSSNQAAKRIRGDRATDYNKTVRGVDAETFGDQPHIVGGNFPKDAMVSRPSGPAPELKMMPSHVPFADQKKIAPAQIQGEANAQRNEELGRMGVTTTPTSDGVNNKYTLPGGQLNYNLSSNDLAIKNSIGAIDAKIKAGFKPSAEQAQRIQEIKRKAGFTRGGTDRGPQVRRQNPTGLKVQFDDSVDGAARSRFLRNPSQPPQNTFNNYTTQGINALSGAEGAPKRELNTFGDVMRAKYDMATNKVTEGNRRFNVNAGLESQKVNSQINNQNIRTGVMVNDSLNKQETMDVGNESRAIVNRLQQQYLQETDPNKKNEIASQLGVIQGRSRQQKSEPWKIVDINTGETDIDGKPTVKQMMFNPNTQQIEDIPQSQLEPTNKVAERVVGGLYPTPKGPMYWNGKGYVKEKPKG